MLHNVITVGRDPPSGILYGSDQGAFRIIRITGDLSVGTYCLSHEVPVIGIGRAGANLPPVTASGDIRIPFSSIAVIYACCGHAQRRHTLGHVMMTVVCIAVMTSPGKRDPCQILVAVVGVGGGTALQVFDRRQIPVTVIVVDILKAFAEQLGPVKKRRVGFILIQIRVYRRLLSGESAP